MFVITPVLGQVNIIPVRTDVSGFSSWTDVDIAGTTYLQLLPATASTTTPAMNFNGYSNETLDFKARTYGGVNATENTVTIWISTDNGSNWTSLGTRTPTTTTLTAVTQFDLSSYSGTQVRIKFTVAGTSNSIGAGIDDITIKGIVIAPSTQSSDLQFSSISNNEMTLTWTSGDGANRIVVARQGSSVDANPSDGSDYTDNTQFGSGSQLGSGNYVVYDGSSNTVTVTGLSAGTTYYFAIFEYNGANTDTKYLTTSPATGSQATTAPSGSTSSDIVSAGNETSNIDYASKQASSISSTSDAVRVWSFTIRDGGGSSDADALSTELTDMTIGKGGSNGVTSWANTIRKAALFDGTTLIAQADVSSESLTFAGMSGSNVTAADNASKTLDLYLTFKTAVTDNEQFQFATTSATANGSGSLFASADAGGASSSVTGDANKIEVTASKLVFTTEPNEFVNPNTNFTVAVKARDANDNDDLDATTSVTLTKASGSGTLSSSTGLTQSLSSGTFTWSDAQLDTKGQNITLSTTNDGSLSNPTTSAFEVSDALLVENFNYTAATLLTSNGWTAHSAAGTEAITVNSTGLTFPNYPSVSGNSALVDNTGEDVNRSFTSVTSGIVYVSFLVQVSQIVDGYFLHIGPSPLGSTFIGRVFIQGTGDGITYRFGLTKYSEAATYSTTTYNKDTTYLVTLKYEIVTGTTNDQVSLFVFTSADDYSSEPSTPTIGPLTPVATDCDPGTIALRQYSASQNVVVDGIRVTTDWSDVPLPVQMASVTVTANRLNATINWVTATEIDNYGFEIERRLINTLDWTTAGFVAGKGNSNSPTDYTFTDAGLAAGKYAYRIKQVNRDGSSEYFAAGEVEVGAAEKRLTLEKNYPNPFNPSTSIEFTVPTDGGVTLKVYNLIGEEVATLFKGEATAGTIYKSTFNASELPSGLYFARLQHNGSSLVRKMLLTK